MDKNRIISFFVLIVCLTGNYSFSQQQKKENKPDQYRAVHWTTSEGLSDDQANVMFKDVKGFLWIGSGSGGLCRFDGTSFKKYPAENMKSGAINCDTIINFEEDALHNIWIGTHRGISRYDIKADTFTNFLPYNDSVLKGSYTGPFRATIAPFWAIKDSMFCIEPGGLITAFNIHTLKRKVHVTLAREVASSIQWSTNQSVFDAGSNSIWVLPANRQALLQIFLNGYTKYHTWHCYRQNIPHFRHGAEEIHYDQSRNSIWINSGEGLLEFSLNDKQFHHIDALNELIKDKDYDFNVGIDIDAKGRIWFATKSRGILIYDPQTKHAESAFTDPIMQHQTSEDNLHIYHDRDGIIWTSNWSGLGVFQITPLNLLAKRYKAHAASKDSLSSSLISTIMPGPGGKLWIGTADGLNIYDPVSETFEVLRQKDLPGVKGTAVIPLYVDSMQQKAWLNVGSQNWFEYFNMNMYEMDLKTRQCSRIIFREGSETINTFLVAHTLARPYKGGLIFCDEWHGVFEIKEGSLEADLVIPLKPGNAGFGDITLVEDRYIFLNHGGALPNYTFENKNGKWTKIAHPTDSLKYYKLLYNKKDKTYWAGLEKELIHYNNEFRVIQSYDPEGSYNGLFLGMQMDNDDNLWFVNLSKKIGRLKSTSGAFSFLSETEGHYKQDYSWFIPSAKDAMGNIYFGIGWKTGMSPPHWGLDRINANKYSGAKPSTVYVRDININQKPYSFISDVELLNELSLKHNENTIRIEAGVIDFFSMQKNQLRYKLERNGEPANWEYSLERNIRYDGLPPGSYRLVILAANGNGEFNGPERILKIHISTPFWQTPWFKILAAITVIGLILGFVQYRSRNLKKRNIILEKKVTERTNELNNSLAELKSTQDQLIQSEKMASLGELTSGIAHEIKNPLNFINNFSELNMELIAELEEEEIKNPDAQYRAHIGQIIKTLKKNSEKINHHGKRVDGIVKGMLQHSRMANASKERVDINSLCDESLKLAWHGFKAKEKTFNASFETRFDPDLPNIMVFPQDLGRVMINLINNAFYAVHEKKKRNHSEPSDDALQIESLYKPCVIVSTKKNGSKIFITVSDNGMGIPSPIMNKIFQPFFTTKPTGEGTGLGLSMSYDIISKSHGGELRAKTKEGLGTDFEIILPVS